MPVIKSAKKKQRVDIKRTAHNRKQKNFLKKLIRSAKKTGSEKAVRAAVSFTDRVARKHIIHVNKAARIKSMLAKRKKPKKKLSFDKQGLKPSSSSSQKTASK